MQLCPGPDGAEVFILCRRAQRSEKEHAIHDRFEKKIAAACRKRMQKAGEVEQRVGRLLGSNARSAGLFEVRVAQRPDGFVDFTWLRREAWRQWAKCSEGCYLLCSNVTDWTPEELWRAYIQFDRGRGGIPDSQVGFAVAARLAPEARAGGGAHSGVLPGLSVVEDAGAVLRAGRARRWCRARCSRRSGRCRPPHPQGSVHPETMYRQSRRPSSATAGKKSPFFGPIWNPSCTAYSANSAGTLSARARTALSESLTLNRP